MTQKPPCSPWTSSPGSHLHVVALLSLHFRVDAELLPGPQHTNLWPGYTKLTLKTRQARTLLYMLRFNISKVKDSGEADEPKARVRARTSQLVCVWLLCVLLDLEALHLCWQQWVLISSSSSQQEVTSSNLHHPPQNLGSVMTAQPRQLGPVIHYKLFPAGCDVQCKVRTELVHYKHSPWIGLFCLLQGCIFPRTTQTNDCACPKSSATHWHVNSWKLWQTLV